MIRIRKLSGRCWFLIVVILGLVSLIGFISYRPSAAKVESFDDCVRHNFPVTESEPPTCVADHKTYVGPYQGAIKAITSAAVDNLPIETLVSGDSRGTYPTTYKVIVSPTDWSLFWTRVHASITPIPQLVPVDFDQHSIVGVVMGTQPTDGYDIRVQSVTRSTGVITVNVALYSPARGCRLDPHPTNPYYLVQVPKLSQGEADGAHFLFNQRERPCR